MERGTIVGSYQVLDPLRRSTYAEVFAARRLGHGARKELFELHALLNTVDGARPALAKLRPLLAKNELASSIDIVSLSGRLCLVQRRPVGENLLELREAGIALPAELAVAMVAAIARQTTRGHGDVRPENVFLDYQKRRMRILQWGVVPTLEKMLRGGCLSAPGCSAPERFSGSVTGQSEVYSLGLLLWELVAEQAAYDGNTPAEIQAAVLKQRLSEPNAPRGRGSRMLNRIIMKAVHPEAQNRFARPSDFARVLEGYLASRGPHANFDGALARFIGEDLAPRALERRRRDLRLLTRAIPLRRLRSSPGYRTPSGTALARPPESDPTTDIRRTVSPQPEPLQPQLATPEIRGALERVRTPPPKLVIRPRLLPPVAAKPAPRAESDAQFERLPVAAKAAESAFEDDLPLGEVIALIPMEAPVEMCREAAYAEPLSRGSTQISLAEDDATEDIAKEHQLLYRRRRRARLKTVLLLALGLSSILWIVAGDVAGGANAGKSLLVNVLETVLAWIR